MESRVDFSFGLTCISLGLSSVAKTTYILIRVCICVTGVLFISLGLRTYDLPSAETTRPGRRREHLLHSCMIGIFLTDKTKVLCQRLFTPVYCLVLSCMSIKAFVLSHKKYLFRNILLCWSPHINRNWRVLCMFWLYFSRVFIALGSRLKSVEGWP